MIEILNNLPDKTQYKNTTSIKFKSDLIDFFKDKKLDVCLEIGTNHGHTTNVLSHLFNIVYTIDLQQENIDAAKEVNKDRTNIIYITGDAYNINNYKDIPPINVGFVDCVHKFNEVLKDIQTCLDKSSPKGIYLIFDDYGHPEEVGVYQAIQKAMKEGLEFETYLGQSAGYKFSTKTLLREEGIILSYKN